ncbi:MAG TPA: matrixin family metalloprotease [Actinomycetota bacterium]|nr:matrixin family metalloprotease [Actinomycetota bacterium]
MAAIGRKTASLLACGVLVAALGSTPAAPAEPLELPLPALDAASLLEIAGVGLPEQGTMLQLHADFPEEAPLLSGGLAFTSVTADLSPDGGMIVRSATPAKASAPAPSATLDECADPAYAETGPQWRDADMPVEWRFRRSSVPDGVGAFRSQYSLQEAHQVWSRARTKCKAAGDVSLRFRFDGDSKRKVGYDGVNLVDFGPLGGGALALSYTWYEGSRIVEVDLRLNRDDYRWTNRPGGKNRYQVGNIGAHEIGHQLGLDDLSDPHGALTMFGRISRGETSKMTLGRGDLRGASNLSP